MDPRDAWVEGVRAAMAAPPLPRSQKRKPGADPKWAIGDALLAAPPEHRDEVATAAGLSRSDARVYCRTAEAWPPSTRTVEAAWTTYRELSSLENRTQVITPGMTMQDAQQARIGRRPYRRAQRVTDDDALIDEIVALMLSPRRSSLVPELLRRLNASKEGRKAARDRRSTAALRRLDEEIRLIQKEIKKRRADKSASLRFMEARRRLLDTEVNVEEVALLFNDPDQRAAAAEDDWRRLGERIAELGDVAHKVASAISVTLDVVDAEAWSDESTWRIEELSGGSDDDEIADAEIVDDS